MKIIQLCNKVPYPEKDGGAIAINSFIKELLKAGHQLKMLAMNTSKHYVYENSIPEDFKRNVQLETINIDNSINPVSAFVALLKGESYNVSRFVSKEYALQLQHILEKETYDIVQLEGLYLTSYIPIIRKHTNAPIIMRAHNVEHRIWERLAKEEKNPLKKIYLGILAGQLKKHEERAINLCDGITTITRTDMDLLTQMGCKLPIAHIPFGVNITTSSLTQKVYMDSLFYIGALDWMPNLQGLEWFLSKVWPLINPLASEVKLHIAGRNMPESMKNSKYPNVVFHGEVENASDFMNSYNIMIAPLLAGSGVRIKIIEGMAMQKPVITTSVGIEGIECDYGKDAMIADTAEEFCKTVVYCIKNPEFTKQLAVNGRNFVETNHNIEKITSSLISFYKERISDKTLNGD